MKRIYHPWYLWECYANGLYARPDGVDADDRREAYRAFLADLPRFSQAMQRVLNEWPRSCEQFLSNENINRIAWLGQAAMCIETRTPCWYRGGFKLLSAAQQRAANELAAKYLQKWQRGIGDEHAKQGESVRVRLEEMRLF